MRREITTKNGFKTHIDKYDVVVNGQMYKRVWGVTRARQYARNYTSDLFSQQTNRVEIVNCYTGEITKIS